MFLTWLNLSFQQVYEIYFYPYNFTRVYNKFTFFLQSLNFIYHVQNLSQIHKRSTNLCEILVNHNNFVTV